MESSFRPTLNDFSSIVCLKAMITGMEESLDEKATAIALTAASRQGGKSLVKSLGLSQSNLNLDKLTSKLATRNQADWRRTENCTGLTPVGLKSQ